MTKASLLTVTWRFWNATLLNPSKYSLKEHSKQWSQIKDILCKNIESFNPFRKYHYSSDAFCYMGKTTEPTEAL